MMYVKINQNYYDQCTFVCPPTNCDYEAKTKHNHVIFIYIYRVVTDSKSAHWFNRDHGNLTQSFLIGTTIRPDDLEIA